ncbi:MAG: TolC family protein [Proteobacteria bacterium]|nr:TolC family protein [Pseudomonadota bacterium]
MDLNQLLGLAEHNYAGLKASAHAIAAAEAKLAEAWVSPFFQLNVTSLFSLVPNVSGHPLLSRDSQLPLSNPWGPMVQVGLQGAIPLWTFGKLGAAREAARAGVRASTHKRKQVLARLRSDVRRAYFGLQFALDTLQMIAEGRAKLESGVALLEQRLEQGDSDANVLDRYRLAAALSEVDARRSEARRLEQTSRAALTLLTGLDEITVPDCPLEPIATEPKSLGWHLDMARTHRPDAGMLRTSVEAREAKLRAERAGYLPDLALTVQASRSHTPGVTNQTNPFVVDPANYNALGAGLAARWSLDLWGNHYRVERASRQLAETRAQAQEALTGISLQIAAEREALLDARRRLAAWRRGHRDTRKWLVTVAQGYQIGTLQARDLVDSLRAYFTARFSHLQAIHDTNSSLARLEQAIGTPIVADDAWLQTCAPEGP